MEIFLAAPSRSSTPVTRRKPLVERRRLVAIACVPPAGDRLHRLRDGAHGRGVLGADVTAAAGCSIVYGQTAGSHRLRVDGGGAGMVATRLARRRRHAARASVPAAAASESRYGAALRRLPARIDTRANVAGLARTADFVLDLVVIIKILRLKLLTTERPILTVDLGDARGARSARVALALPPEPTGLSRRSAPNSEARCRRRSHHRWIGQRGE